MPSPVQGSLPGFDLFTLNVVTAVILLLAGVAMWLVHTLNTGCHGLRRCVVACLSLFAGFALIPLRLIVPGKLPILLSNFALFAGALLLVDGIRAFRELYRPLRAYAAVSVAYVVIFCWFLFVHDDPKIRGVVDAFFMGPLGLFAAEAMAWNVPPRDRSVYWSTAAGFAVHGISICARGFVVLFGPTFVLYQPTAIDFVNIVTINLATLGCAFGLAMATNLRLQRKTEKLALYDSLTNLPNRRLFEDRLEEAERKAFATGSRIALIYCDLDDFKGINDTLGHEGGDQALRVVAKRLRQLVNEEVCLARIGGDEFLVLLENAPSRDHVLAMIERLRKGVEGNIEFQGRTATLRISCGLAIFPEDVGSASDLIRLADAGMYMMKQHGRYSPA